MIAININDVDIAIFVSRLTAESKITGAHIHGDEFNRNRKADLDHYDGP